MFFLNVSAQACYPLKSIRAQICLNRGTLSLDLVMIIMGIITISGIIKAFPTDFLSKNKNAILATISTVGGLDLAILLHQLNFNKSPPKDKNQIDFEIGFDLVEAASKLDSKFHFDMLQGHYHPSRFTYEGRTFRKYLKEYWMVRTQCYQDTARLACDGNYRDAGKVASHRLLFFASYRNALKEYQLLQASKNSSKNLAKQDQLIAPASASLPEDFLVIQIAIKKTLDQTDLNDYFDQAYEIAKEINLHNETEKERHISFELSEFTKFLVKSHLNSQQKKDSKS